MQQQRELTRNPYKNDKRFRNVRVSFCSSYHKAGSKAIAFALLLFLLTFLGIQKSKKVSK
jgi:hypothetical protein